MSFRTKSNAVVVGQCIFLPTRPNSSLSIDKSDETLYYEEQNDYLLGLIELVI